MSEPQTPAPIPFNPATATFVEQLIAQADALEVNLDEEPYSDDPNDGHPRPRVKAAHAIKARPFSRFQASGFAVLRSVTGSDKHPMCRSWLNYVHSPVVDAARRGAGILEGFLDAWKLGALWPASDEPDDSPQVSQKPEDFGQRSI